MNKHDRLYQRLQKEANEAGDPWDTYIVIVSVMILIWLLLGGAQ